MPSGGKAYTPGAYGRKLKLLEKAVKRQQHTARGPKAAKAALKKFKSNRSKYYGKAKPGSLNYAVERTARVARKVVKKVVKKTAAIPGGVLKSAGKAVRRGVEKAGKNLASANARSRASGATDKLKAVREVEKRISKAKRSPGNRKLLRSLERELRQVRTTHRNVFRPAAGVDPTKKVTRSSGLKRGRAASSASSPAPTAAQQRSTARKLKVNAARKKMRAVYDAKAKAAAKKKANRLTRKGESRYGEGTGGSR